MVHTCHARLCNTKCLAEYLMCRKHWAMVPRKLQLAVWKHYRKGQCDDKRPSPQWHEAADAAIAAVALKEGCPFGKLRTPEVVALARLAFELVPIDRKEEVDAFLVRGPYLHGKKICGWDPENGQTFVCKHCNREVCYCLGSHDAVEEHMGPICSDCWVLVPKEERERLEALEESR
jgi:hypothetical protein